MARALTVVLAPDSFKGSLAAREAAEALARGWAQVRPHDELVLRPQADGGEGTLEAIAAASSRARVHECVVTGPDGRPVTARWLELDDHRGVIELAQSSGLPLMAAPDALGATTRGLGEVIRNALDAGMTSLSIALGGSASTDGGAGAFTALGLELKDARGRVLPDGGGALSSLAHADRDRLIAPPPGGVTLLTDVTAPLLGPRGAAAVFGPQKGATEAQLPALEAGLARWAEVLGGDPDTPGAEAPSAEATGAEAPGAGAAGGTAFGFATAWGAEIVSGAAFVAALTGLESAVHRADVVLTGEGRFDATSMAGKTTGHVLELVRRYARPAGIIAGHIDTAQLTADALANNTWTLALTHLAGSVNAALTHPERHLERAGAEAARHFGARYDPE